MSSLDGIRFKIKTLKNSDLKNFNNDNLHRIAISNLTDNERRVARWWSKKYKTPLKGYFEHSFEELVIEMLEDFYEANPDEIENTLRGLSQIEEEEWDGTPPDDYLRHTLEKRKKFFAKHSVDLSDYQDEVISNEDLSPEEEEELMKSLARLPNRVVSQTLPTPRPRNPAIIEDEFDETF